MSRTSLKAGAYTLRRTVYFNVVRTCTAVEHTSVFFQLNNSIPHSRLHRCQGLVSVRHEKACPLVPKRCCKKPPIHPTCIICSCTVVRAADRTVCCCMLRTIPSFEVHFARVPIVPRGELNVLLSCLRFLISTDLPPALEIRVGTNVFASWYSLSIFRFDT